MKLLATLVLLAAISGSALAQDPVSAAAGVTYGAGATAENAVPAAALSSKINNGQFTGKVTGKVTDVCQKMGCWMKLETGQGEPIMVKFKDYGFFMPKDIVGKEVVLDGEATVTETSVKQLKHYAKDAGKSKEEISKIKAPKRETVFVANGVLVL